MESLCSRCGRPIPPRPWFGAGAVTKLCPDCAGDLGFKRNAKARIVQAVRYRPEGLSGSDLFGAVRRGGISMLVAIVAIGLVMSTFAVQLGVGQSGETDWLRISVVVIGAALGFLVLEASVHGAPRLPLFAVVLAPLLVLTAIKPNLRMSGVTLIVVVLVPSTSEPFIRPFDRVVEILLGVVASLIVAATIGPTALWRRKSNASAADEEGVDA